MNEEKIKGFYIDNLLLTNGTECSENYKTIFDHLKDMMFEGYTPHKLCMGVKNIRHRHEYDDNRFGFTNSDGICSYCFDIYKKLKNNKKFDLTKINGK